MHGDNHEIVVLAGSGRSGTTWLGAIMDTYSRAEYFYEIDAFPELDFDSPGLLKSKYPLTYWLPQRTAAIVHLEQKLLLACRRSGVFKERVDMALRIRNRIRAKQCSNSVYLFKIVQLYEYALRCDELASRHHGNFRTVHIIRNPYAQLVSQIRVDNKHAARASQHFADRTHDIIDNPRLERYHADAEKYKDASWVEQMALMWWISNELMQDACSRYKCAVIYEDLARNPLVETQRIFDFIGWELSTETREFISSTTDASTTQKGNFSIHKSADEVLEKWKQEITPKDYDCIRAVLEPCKLTSLWADEDLQR